MIGTSAMVRRSGERRRRFVAETLLAATGER